LIVRIQMESNLVTVPLGPNWWNKHVVLFGKILAIGSLVSSFAVI
jgi:hypothetical protein